jgi:hypothetical protein
MNLNAVTQLNQTIIEAFDGLQIQRHVTVPPRDHDLLTSATLTHQCPVIERPTWSNLIDAPE